MKYSTVLFDLDGTLTDPKIGITKSVQYALKKFDILVTDLDTLEPFIGPPLFNSFTELYSFTETQAEEAINYYREYFRVNGLYENEIYEGIPELLENLIKKGCTLFVATSKPKVFADQIIEHFGIKKYFKFVYGSNLDGTLSDKSQLIKHLIAEEKLSKSNTVMIGDRKYDIIGAQINEIDSIGVGYGYGSEKELFEAKPTYYKKTLQDLSDFFIKTE